MENKEKGGIKNKIKAGYMIREERAMTKTQHYLQMSLADRGGGLYRAILEDWKMARARVQRMG